MKRISYLLVLVILLTCLPLTVFGAKVGEKVTVNFTAENPGLTGYRAIINYDNSALKLVSVTAKAGTSDLNGNSIAVMSATPFHDSLLFTATFEVLSGAKTGKSYAVTAIVKEAYDANVEEIDLSISGGTIRIDKATQSSGTNSNKTESPTTEATEAPTTEATELPTTEPTEIPTTEATEAPATTAEPTIPTVEDEPKAHFPWWIIFLLGAIGSSVAIIMIQTKKH